MTSTMYPCPVTTTASSALNEDVDYHTVRISCNSKTSSFTFCYNPQLEEQKRFVRDLNRRLRNCK